MYLDNASTTWPKPPEVPGAVHDFISGFCPNPGRGTCGPSDATGRTLLRCRIALADLFECNDPLRVCLTPGVTWAINTVILGILRPGDHVVTGSMEHNAVMRPIRYLSGRGVEYTVVRCDPGGRINPDDFAAALRPHTKLAVLNHASNVNGAVSPVEEAGRICGDRGIPLMVDTAQSAGVVPAGINRLNADIVAFTGHKALFGPMATGGLVFSDRFDPLSIEPLVHGGTGTRSEADHQPDFLPDRFEPGTPNGPGIAGLLAGVEFVRKTGSASIMERECKLTQALVRELRSIPGVRVFHADDGPATAVVSFRIDGMENRLVAGALSEEWGICCRHGLHCSPCAHRTLGTLPGGLIRFSPGYFNTEDEMTAAADAVRTLAERRN